MGTCHVLPSLPSYPHSDLGILILTFLFPLQNSHRGHHPGWRRSGSQRFLLLRSQGTERWTRVPSPTKCSHTAHTCTHRDGGSSQQEQPSPCAPTALGRISGRCASLRRRGFKSRGGGGGMRKQPVSTLHAPSFFFSPAPSSFSKMYDSE